MSGIVWKTRDEIEEAMERECADLRTQLEAVTRERDSWRLQRDEVHAEMERQTKLKHEERQAKLDAMRERDEAQAVLRKCHEVAWSRGGDLNGDPVCDLMLMRGTFQAHITTLERERDEARADAARLREALGKSERALTNVLCGLGARVEGLAARDAARAALTSAPSVTAKAGKS